MEAPAATHLLSVCAFFACYSWFPYLTIRASSHWKRVDCRPELRLRLESLERRRLCFDLIFVYKILFRLADLNASDFFVIRTGSITRDHPYRLVKPRCSINARRDLFSVRVINPSNSLPATAQDFKSLTCFKCVLKKVDLTKYTCF